MDCPAEDLVAKESLVIPLSPVLMKVVLIQKVVENIHVSNFNGLAGKVRWI